MVDGLEDPKKLHQVPQKQVTGLESLKTQMEHLQVMVASLSDTDQKHDFLKQELRDSAQMMQGAVMDFREMRQAVHRLQADMHKLEERVGKLEDKK